MLDQALILPVTKAKNLVRLEIVLSLRKTKEFLLYLGLISSLA